MQQIEAGKAVDDGLLVTYGDSVKALGDGRVGGYLVRFSTPDDPDLEGDFYTPDTDFGPAEKSVVLYHHGIDKTLKRRRLAEGTLKADEVGIWVEAQLELRDRYEKAIYDMAKANKLGWSSGTASHLVERKTIREGVHQITSWPLGLDASLTPTPCEPRNSALSLKSLPDETFPVTEDEPCSECAAKSLAVKTDHAFDLLADLLVGYQQVKLAQTEALKAGKPQLSAARRERLERLRADLDDLLSETAPREEDADAAATPEPMREAAAPKSLPTEPLFVPLPTSSFDTSGIIAQAFEQVLCTDRPLELSAAPRTP